jgi:hypothetical protein
MRKITLAVAVILFSLSSLFAQQGGVKKGDPCALITKADIQQAAGTSAEDGKNDPQNSAGPNCTFKVGGMGVLSLVVRQSRPDEKPDLMVAAFKRHKIKVEEAAGIGDRSIFTSPGFGTVQLNTFKGSNYLILTMAMLGSPEAKQHAIAEKLMQKVLSKL